MKKKICFVVTIPEIVHAFLKDHIAALSKEYDVFLVGDIADKKQVQGLAIRENKNIKIFRKIALWSDIKAICSLYKYIRNNKFDVVHSAMPKAGLIAAVASFFAFVPKRVHIFTGQIWATQAGFKRWLLKNADRLICLLDNYILLDGKSQREFMIDEHVLDKNKGIVFGEGSICGVNTERFIPDEITRQEERKKYGIYDNGIVYIFLGRLNHDKGIYDLLNAFNRLLGLYQDVYLLLAGADEEGIMGKLGKYSRIKRDENLFYVGYVNQPERYLQAGDVFCLPTYREGFGSSAIEAACLGIPSICSDVYGVRDAMIDNVTGLRCHVDNVDSLFECMEKYHNDRELLRSHGNNARARVIKDFSGEKMTQYWLDFYHSILK